MPLRLRRLFLPQRHEERREKVEFTPFQFCRLLRFRIVQNLCGWEGHDANLWRKIDPQVFGLYGFAKAGAQTTLPTDKVPANMKNIKLLREAYHCL